MRESRKTKSASHSCERRGGNRLLCSNIVRLTWSEPSGERRAEIAILENMSLSGVGLFLGVHVPDGLEIKIAANEMLVSGVVRTCQFRENGWLVCVELDAESKWAQEPKSGFVPEHFLDVSLLQLD
ncbi:MAG TPA: hypothetical protein VH351_12230 [Bryobacteraceae bacterium]|nr:hypothetical protein [Bryobacteraceae bacterium]